MKKKSDRKTREIPDQALARLYERFILMSIRNYKKGKITIDTLRSICLLVKNDV